MSLDLKDLRCKITAFAWCHLEGESRATGQDQSEIVREIINSWAGRRHSEIAHKVALHYYYAQTACEEIEKAIKERT